MNQPEPEYRPKTIFSEPDGGPQSVLPPLSPVATAGQIQSANSAAAARSSKGPLIIIVIVVVVCLVIGAGAFVASNSSKKSSNKQATDSSASSVLQPAQPLELEQTNNALSQDLSGLDDGQDFPPTALDDKTLGL